MGKDIIVTRAMIETGVAVLRESGRIDSEADGADELLVRKMLDAILPGAEIVSVSDLLS